MEKERIVFSNIDNVRLSKDIVIYCWFDENHESWSSDKWMGALSPTDNIDKLTTTFTGYTKEGLIGNIEETIRATYNKWIRDEIEGYEFYVDTFVEYFKSDDKKVHDKKIESKYFVDIADGYKTFEFRKNDEDYKIGDTLVLREWKDNNYTGHKMTCVIIYIIKGDELNRIYPNCISDDYCILGIEVMRYDCDSE